eukprot:g48626.t1
MDRWQNYIVKCLITPPGPSMVSPFFCGCGGTCLCKAAQQYMKRKAVAISTEAASSSAGRFISLDRFALRQFDKNAGVSHTVIDYDPQAFISKVNEFYESKKASAKEDSEVLVDGYAPFCKHLFMPNFLKQLPPAAIVIDATTEPLIKSKYEARSAKELPVLVRYVPRDSLKKLPEAKYLDLILYSREQIKKENAAMGNELEEEEPEPWGLISIKPQMESYETPMQPITMLRNALGKDQGGSGVALDREKYQASVDYWSKHGSMTISFLEIKIMQRERLLVQDSYQANEIAAPLLVPAPLLEKLRLVQSPVVFVKPSR